MEVWVESDFGQKIRRWSWLAVARLVYNERERKEKAKQLGWGGGGLFQFKHFSDCCVCIVFCFGRLVVVWSWMPPVFEWS